MTRMKIVQWDNQPERFLSVKDVLQRNTAAEHVAVGSLAAFRSSLESGPVDLVLAPARFWPKLSLSCLLWRSGTPPHPADCVRLHRKTNRGYLRPPTQ